MFNFIIMTYCIVVAINLIYKNKKSIKQLTAKQCILAAITYIFTILFIFICIYFGGNWIAGQFTNRFLQLVVFTMFIFIILSLCQWPLRKTLHRFTSGIFPKN
ncbi:hypothetical protein AEA09_10580 [Lysinibacillus contaminans]|uniref:Uncharacterized protein n=1 Tax=Lysinibacillus contaminans TaxID=1293441 RepID=A0ABR5K1Z3_9BACI|nr:hypothetical protein AEA09_10580 [Lysinibacillus contaminans]